MKDKVLLVENEPVLQETLVYNLQHQGYEVEAVGDGNAAISAARQFIPDLILMELVLPDIGGFEMCRLLRKELSAPIIFLTARDEAIDRIAGLEIGGDDYISKPISMRELYARVNARLRMTRLFRQQGKCTPTTEAALQETKQFGNLSINEERREVVIDRQILMLKPKQFELLLFFTKNARRVLSREYIIKNVWGSSYMGDSQTVDVHVRWLREKIEYDPSHPARIITVRGFGYLFDG